MILHFNRGTVTTTWVRPVLSMIVMGIFALAAGTSVAHAQAGVDAFVPAPDAQVFSIAVQPDGKIVIGGDFTEVGGEPRAALARLTPDGTPDAFAPTTNDLVSTVVVQPDGSLLVGGNFTEINGVTRNYIARLNSTGVVDSGFDPGADERVYSILRQPDGRILVAGVFANVGGEESSYLARLDATGAPEAGFAPAIDDYITAVALDTDGKILIGGAFTKVDDKNRGRLARLNPDGTLDTAFTPSANDEVYAIVLQADGKILVGGRFTKIGATDTGALVRLNPDGSLDPGFQAEVSGGAVVSIAQDAAGRIVIGGDFAGVNGTDTPRFARLLPDGTLDGAVNLPVNAGQIDGFVSALTIQPDGKILLGGAFNEVGTTARQFMARIENTGPLTETLAVTTLGDRITWLRDGSAPELTSVEFAYATDGATFASVGQAMRIPGGWELTDVALPPSQPVTVRARGVHYTNVYGAASLLESTVVTQTVAALLTVQTITIPDGPAGSTWQVNNQGPTPFTTVLTGTATSDLRAVASGAYTTTLAPLDSGGVDYTTTHTCTVNGAPGPAGNTATIALQLNTGDNVVCRFTNRAELTPVIVTKAVTPGLFVEAAPEDWTFTVDGETVAHGETVELLQGTYTVTEAGPAGYTATAAAGACALAGDGIELSVPAPTANITATCVITNTVLDTGVVINLLEAFGVSPLTEGVTEGAGSQTCYWITASDAPDGPVTVSLTPAGQVLTDRTNVVLNADNWDNTAASDTSNLICMRAVDDEIDAREEEVCKERTTSPLGGAPSGEESCGDQVVYLAHRITASGDDRFFNGIPFVSNGLADLDGDPRTVDVLLTDNDVAGIVVSPPEKATLRERESTHYTLRVQTEPRGPVQLDLLPDDALRTDRPQVVFDATNWRNPVTVTVTAVQDFVDTGSELRSGQVTHRVVTTDTNYAVLEPADVRIDVTNIDRAGFVFSRESLTIPANGSVRYGVILTAKPQAPVVIVLTPSTGSRVDATCPVEGIRYCLEVTAATWDTLQLVTVTSDGSPGGIGHTLRSDDVKFDGLSATIPVNQGEAYTIHLPHVRQDQE